MNLLDIIAKPIQSVKEALDLEPPSLTGQLAQIKSQLMKVQERLSESRALSREKDALILELKNAMAIRDDMVLEESAYYIKKSGKIVDGPFCSCCADRDGKSIHLVSAPKPKGQTGRVMDWVQCPQCQMPFRSKQAGECLKARQPASTSRRASRKPPTAKAKAAAKPKRSPQAGRKATPKKATATRTTKKSTPTKAKAAAKPKRTAQTRTTKKATASKTRSKRSSR